MSPRLIRVGGGYVASAQFRVQLASERLTRHGRGDRVVSASSLCSLAAGGPVYRTNTAAKSAASRIPPASTDQSAAEPPNNRASSR